jgi:hypothetical protein
MAYLVILLLCICTFLNGHQTYRFNFARKIIDGGWSRYVRNVGRFVAWRKKENNFSFNIFYSEQRKAIAIYEGDPETGIKHVGFFVDFLFREYIKPDHPRYYLVFTGKDGLVVFKDKSTAQGYLDSFKKNE